MGGGNFTAGGLLVQEEDVVLGSFREGRLFVFEGGTVDVEQVLFVPRVLAGDLLEDQREDLFRMA